MFRINISICQGASGVHWGCSGGGAGGAFEGLRNGVGALAGRSSTGQYMRKKYKRGNKSPFIFSNYMKLCVLSYIPKEQIVRGLWAVFFH